MKLTLRGYFLCNFQDFQSFESKILNSFLLLRNRYEAITKHWEEILIYGLVEEVLYRKHLNQLQLSFRLLKLQLNHFHL